MKVTPGGFTLWNSRYQRLGVSNSTGFTIVEVMLVLIISGVMLGSAIAVFSGRRETTEFSQAMYDLQSEFQSIANGVSSQVVPGSQDYICAPASVGGVMRPALTAGNPTGQDCIYIGRAVQVTQNSSTIYSYPVFGLRTVYNGAVDTGDYPDTLAASHPEPAIKSSDPTDPNNMVLIDTYVIPDELQVVSAKLSGAENNIVALYSNLQSNNTSGNEISVLSTNYIGAAADPKAQVKACIEGSGCPAAWNNVTAASWNLCVSDGTRQAQLSLKATATGIVTSLNMNGCS